MKATVVTSSPTSRSDAPSTEPGPRFDELGVPAPVARALADRGIDTAFPIQAVTLPDTLAGRDVLGRGRTGSGKTIAFAIPTVVVLSSARTERRPRSPRGLILVPTRELAAQVADTLVPLATSLQLKVAIIHGGVSAGPQIKALATADIVVACPGRLEDLIAQRQCSLDRVAITVLDEADHMADLGFLPSVKRLLDRTPREGQRLLFSATLDNGVDVLVKRYLHEPVTHSVDPPEAEVPDMRQMVWNVTAADKPLVVRELASGRGRCLLFTRTKHGAKKLAGLLSKSGIPSVELHGNLSQNARTRNLEEFSTGDVTVLVATDIAARGIHIDDIELVVHVDPPAEHKAFLHRSGRTARAGAAGTVVTIVTPDQRRDVEALTRRAGIKPEISTVHPGDPCIVELVGEPAEPVMPRPVTHSAPPRAGAPRASSGRPRRSGAAPARAGRSSASKQAGSKQGAAKRSNGQNTPGHRGGAKRGVSRRSGSSNASGG